jgi:transposase
MTVELQPGCGPTENQKPTYDELVQIIVELRTLVKVQAEKIRQLEEENKILKKKLYGSSSEKSKRLLANSGGGSGRRTNKNAGQPRVRSLAKQYPNAEIEDRYVEFKELPLCLCCHRRMVDSGLEEVTEQVHTIPARHKILRLHRRKYKCTGCFTGLISAPLDPRIAPGSSLSDSFIIDAAIAKFFHLIPAERYAKMISQNGLIGFAPQLVLSAHHYLAVFLKSVHSYLQEKIQLATLLFADETRHRMLENNGDKSWYLWSFTGNDLSCYEIHNTRSGSVAIEFIAKSKCLYLMSDVYSGYIRTVREVNAIRRKLGLPEIVALFCNAHSRRRFVESLVNYPEESQYFILQYKEIYRLEGELKAITDPKSRAKKRTEMKPFFEAMLAAGKQLRQHYSDNSSLATAIDYYTNNYEGLTRFLESPELPIDNNLSERQLRSPVIGRKTWFGTHSEQGNETTETLFTLMQSCKHLNVNPRDYLQALIRSIHASGPPFTPSEYLATLRDGKAA